jgi:hypothetical protein
VPDSIDSLAGLRPVERRRLERFAAAFDRLDASAYIQLADVVLDGDVGPAQEAARELIGRGQRLDAVRAVIQSFVDAASVAYSRRSTLTDTFLMNQSLPDRAEDRVRFLASVERAVVGLILWDELDPSDRVVLIGPWEGFVQDAGEAGA